MQAAQKGQFGLTPLDFARYFFAVFLVRQMTVVWVIFEFEKEVVQGKLSPKLLQPLDPVWHHVASHISERLARFPFVFLLIGLFFVFILKLFGYLVQQLITIYDSRISSFCTAVCDSIYISYVRFLDRKSDRFRKFLVFTLFILIGNDCAFKGIS